MLTILILAHTNTVPYYNPHVDNPVDNRLLLWCQWGWVIPTPRVGPCSRPSASCEVSGACRKTREGVELGAIVEPRDAHA
jgi:hypothetical protein